MANKKLGFVIGAKNETDDAFKKVDKNLKQAKKDSESLGASFKKMMPSAKGVGLAISGALTAAGGSLVAITTSAAAAAAEIDNLSRVAGISSEDLQKMSYAALDFGISQEKVSDVLKDVNDRVGDFVTAKAGPMVDFFEKIAPQVGVTAKNFEKLNSKEALQLYVSSLEKANVSQQEMTFYMEAIAGDATALLPLFRDGGKAMAEQAAEAERLGIVLSNTDVALLDAANDATEKAKVGFKALGSQLAVKFSPILSGLADKFYGMAEEAGGFGEIADKAFRWTIKGAGFVANAVRGIEVVFKGVSLAAVITFEKTLKGLRVLEKGVLGFIDKLPFVEVQTDTALNKIIAKTVELKKSIQENIHKTLTEPMPADSLEAWSSNVTRKYRETAEKVAQIKQESINNDFSQSQAAQETIKEQDKTSREEKIQKELENQNIAKNHIQARLDFEKQTNSQRVAAAFGTASKIGAGFANHSKKMFKLQQAAGISETLINTYHSATGAYKAMASIPIVGPALGAAAAAAAIAAGKANVDQIKAQKFQGQAHSGLDFVPKTGTYLLEQGERVVKKEDNRKLEKALDSGVAANDLTVNFNISAIDTRAGTDYILQNQNVIVSIIQNAFTERGRAGPLG